MADVTVKQLAQVVGIPVERLLTQLQDAGIPIADQDHLVNEEQKRALLNHLKGHVSRETSNRPERITLKRKSMTQVTLGHDVHSGKTVNIEVRKKRTYVKRPVQTQDIPSEDTMIQKELIQSPVSELHADSALSSPTVSHEVSETLEMGISVDMRHIQTDMTVTPELTEGTSGGVPTVVVNTTPQPSEPMTEQEKENVQSDQKLDKSVKKRFSGKDEREGTEVTEEFKKAKKKAKYHEPVVTDEDDDGLLGYRHKKTSRYKKRKSSDKSDRYREAEESMKHAFAVPTAPVIREVLVPETITVAELAKRMSVKAPEVIKVMMSMGALATINQVIDQDTAAIVVEEMGHKPKILKEDAIEQTLGEALSKGSQLATRAPVVTIMGHVDHGKTSLLDYIRATRVASFEAGGITQHIGAYHVATSKGEITFLDTPGHAAFTAMRARGAKVTDIVILIVAADDGVKPQTIEAIQHAKAAKVPMIVAINKIDKPDADADRVMNELSVHEVIPEAWGGDTMFVKISAKAGTGIDELLDAILLQAEVLELKALVDGAATGVVIESRLDKGRGPVATVLVQNGTLRKGDILLAGFQYGRVRALVDDAGRMVESVGPSMPVEVLGLSAIPHAGDEAVVVPDEKRAREVALFRQGKFRDIKLARKQKNSLEGMMENMVQNEASTLNIVLKADVQGSIEAITDALTKLSTEEVKVAVIASGVGGITESDVHLAIASQGILMGFNVRADNTAKRLAENESVSLYYFSVIYDIVDQVKSALTGMLSPEFKEEIVGIAEVRDVFRSPKLGAIAGCMVLEGVIKRNNPIRVLRNHVVIYEGTLESLRRFKDDVVEVKQGIECGIGVKNYNDVKPGDLIEVFETVEVKRTL